MLITSPNVTSIAKTGSTALNGAVTLTETTNQVLLAQSGQVITLSTPQNIHTGAAPTFAGGTENDKVTFYPPSSTTTSTTGQYAALCNINANTSQYATINGNGDSWIPINFLTNTNNFGGIYGQNLSNGGNASTDIVLMNDAGTSTTNYIDMGVNSSLNNNASYTVQGAGAGYIYVNGGDMVMGTQSAKQIILHTNGTLSANERFRITSAGLVGIGAAGIALSSTFQVTGSATNLLTITDSTPATILNLSKIGTLTLNSQSSSSSTIFALNSINAAGSGTANLELRFIDGGVNAFRFLAAVGNAIGARYGGLIATHDRDGNSLPIQMFTEDSGAIIRSSLWVDTGQLSGTGGPIGVNNTNPLGQLHVIANGVRTATWYSGYFQNTSTNTTTDGIDKYGVYITSTGTFTGSSGTATNNYGLYINTPSGGDNNYALFVAGGAITGAMDTMTYATTISLNTQLGNLHKTTTVNATGNATINASDAGKSGQQIWVLIINDATSGKVITFGTNFKANGTLTGTTSKGVTVHFVSDGVNWYEQARSVAL